MPRHHCPKSASTVRKRTALRPAAATGRGTRARRAMGAHSSASDHETLTRAAMPLMSTVVRVRVRVSPNPSPSPSPSPNPNPNPNLDEHGGAPDEDQVLREALQHGDG